MTGVRRDASFAGKYDAINAKISVTNKDQAMESGVITGKPIHSGNAMLLRTDTTAY